mgnify:CR=1 FL=1
MMISPLGPTAASCLMPLPKREPMPAAIMTNAVFIRFPPEISVILTSSYFYIVKNRITAFRSGPIRKDPRTPAAM